MTPKTSATQKPTPCPAAKSPTDALPRSPRKPPTVTRGSLTRMEFIHERLCAVEPGGRVKVTRQSLAAELCRSRSQLNADIRQMREVFGAPIVWDAVRGTLFYARVPGQKAFELHPRATVSFRGALALLVNGRRTFPFGAVAQEALRKILPLINGGLTFDINLVDTVCSAPETPATETALDHLVALLNAIAQRREVRLTYEKLTPGAAPETRTVHPLHVVTYSDSCLVIAHEPRCGDRRNFELARIRAVHLTGATFRSPVGFDLPAYLAGGIDRFLGEARHEIRVRVIPAFTRYLEERPWQRGQLLERLPDGSAEATYRVAHPQAIEQRVLAAGGQAEVLSPPDVRARIRAAAEAILQTHAPRSTVARPLPAAA